MTNSRWNLRMARVETKQVKIKFRLNVSKNMPKNYYKNLDWPSGNSSTQPHNYIYNTIYISIVDDFVGKHHNDVSRKGFYKLLDLTNTKMTSIPNENQFNLYKR